MYMYMCVYIYIERERDLERERESTAQNTANLRSKILDFGGFDSSRILILRGGLPRPVLGFPESFIQEMQG